MDFRVAFSTIIFALVSMSLPAANTYAADKGQQQSHATKTSVAAQKLKLERARDDMRSLANMSVPKGLTVAQQNSYRAEMAKVHKMADGADRVIKTIDAGKGDLDSLSELGESESMRIQAAMEKLSEYLRMLSNVLKASSDTAKSIAANLK